MHVSAGSYLTGTNVLVPMCVSPTVWRWRLGCCTACRGAALTDAGMDVVDLAVEGALRRIRRWVQALEEGDPDAIYSLL